MNIYFKNLKSSDHDKALDIIKALPEYFTTDAVEDISNDLQNPAVSKTGAYIDGELTAFLCGKFHEDKTVELIWLAVLPKFQKQSLGRTLVTRLLNLARENGAAKVWLHTLASTVHFAPYQKTRNFYEKIGFRETSIDKDYYDVGDDRGTMEIAVTAPADSRHAPNFEA